MYLLCARDEAVWAEHCDPDYACKFIDLLVGRQHISYTSMRSLAGHAFHLPLFGQMLMHVLSNVVVDGAASSDQPAELP